MKYTIGVDFGTQSGRAVLVCTANGQIVATAEQPYPHGCYTKALPGGDALPPDWALQDPADYRRVLQGVVRQLAGTVAPQDIIGICVDATACTLLPVDERYRPLCEQPAFASRPHAWLKLWKHHSPVEQAERITQTARRRGEAFLPLYGGKCHTEWMFPKILELLEQDPELYHAAARFMEVGDWLSAVLCGQERRNSCAAGYKAFWSEASGYPCPDFFAELHPQMEHVVAEKLGGEVCRVGSRAGYLTKEAAQALSLPAGIAVCTAHTDAHVAPPAVGITAPGSYLMIIGTSTCNMLLSERLSAVPGMCGVVADGIVPGLYGYEAGQSAVGDLLNWVVTHSPYRGEPDAHRLLSAQAARCKPGQSGLLMLDWFNGNRSVLLDAALSGLVVGMSLSTTSAELYLAAMEATAFGQKRIIENFRAHGIAVERLYACGGISRKNPLMMQLYADILELPVTVSAAAQVPALGAALYAAVAAGAERGGYETIFDASAAMRAPDARVYLPRPCPAYAALYRHYCGLYEHFGRESALMKQLLALRRA